MNQSPEHTFDFLQPTDRNLTFTCCPVALQFLVLTACVQQNSTEKTQEKKIFKTIVSLNPSLCGLGSHLEARKSIVELSLIAKDPKISG